MFDETKNAIKEDGDPPKDESGTKFVQLDCLSEDETSEEQPPPQVEEPSLPLRHSTRERRAPDFYGESQLLNHLVIQPPSRMHWTEKISLNG